MQSNPKPYNSGAQTQLCWSPNVNAAFMCHSLHYQQYNYVLFGNLRPHKLYFATIARLV